MAEMFTEVVRPSIRVGAKRWYTVPLSIVAHAVLLAAIVVVPLLATGTLPLPSTVIVFAAPAPPTPPEMPRAPTPPKAMTAATAAASSSSPPTEAPSTIQPEPALLTVAVPGTIGLPPGVTGVDGGLPPWIAPVAPTPAAPPEPLRPGGQIKVPVKVHDVAPVYPALAIRAKATGDVIIDATIDAEGRVVDAKVLRSQPLLDKAAVDAVRQWRYQPTLLNGVPVSILLRVTVTFALK